MNRRILARVLVLFAYLAPIAWFLLAAFKSRIDVVAIPPRLGFTPSLAAFQSLLGSGVLRALFNSFVVALLSSVLTTLFAVPAALAVRKMGPRMKDAVLFSALSTRMVLPTAMAIPIYLLFRNVSLLDTRTGLVLMHISVNLGFAVWVLASYVDEVPLRLEELAQLDGLGGFQVFRLVLLPLVAPGVVVVMLFSFVFSWNEYLFASILSAFEAGTLPVQVPALTTHSGTLWPEIAALSLLLMLPSSFVVLAGTDRVTRAMSFGLVHGRK
jgi:ABC-type glycerol-3-phosphate transport system permease component